MQKIIRPRAGGKTTQLIKMASEANGWIVCHSRAEAERIALQAEKMGLHLFFPITYQELLENHPLNPYRAKLFIDNADLLVQFIAGRYSVEAITMTDV